MMKFSLQIGAPDLYRPHPEIVAAAGRRCTLTNQPSEAVAGADLVVTDTWAGMGQEAEKAERLKVFHGFQIDSQMMAGAAPDALFMHCLPAYRGQEVAAEVIDGLQSVVWDEAENRLHAQKALIEFLLA
jgi:ornithine carbamoyltransferase